jgi:hypothetical protein
MPDPNFETVVTGQLREFAEAGVRPIDRFAIAEETLARGRTVPRWRLGWGAAPMRADRVLVPLLVGLLLAALVGGALLVGGRLVAPKTPLGTSDSIFVRRDDGAEPGVSVVAVRTDGSEVLVRKVVDSSVPGSGRLSEWGTVSASGWIALAVERNGWPMVLVDLSDERAEPWVIREANTGGIGPRWGPTGLVAADAGSTGGRVVIADPGTHTTRTLEMPGGLVGGGPSIVWAADGSGIVSGGSVVPVDGGDPRPGVGAVFDWSGHYGSGLAELRICSPGENCPGGDDGRVERVELNGSAASIWQQVGTERALAGSFGKDSGEYWLGVDHDDGRQVALVHLHDGRQEAVGVLNRSADWQSVGAPTEAPDGSSLVVWIDVAAKPAAVLVPLNGGQPTYHTGNFAGFVDAAALVAIPTGEPAGPAHTLRADGEAYRLPPLDELIASEQSLNPGQSVLGRASRDAIEGATDRRTFEVHRDQLGGGELYLDCLGPSSVTVTSGSDSTTSPCLRAGSFSFQIGASGPITVSATGDTTWRVVIYSP